MAMLGGEISSGEEGVDEWTVSGGDVDGTGLVGGWESDDETKEPALISSSGTERRTACRVSRRLVLDDAVADSLEVDGGQRD